MAGKTARGDAGCAAAKRALPYDGLGELDLTEYAFKEAMRLMPPVPSIPRRAVKPFSSADTTFRRALRRHQSPSTRWPSIGPIPTASTRCASRPRTAPGATNTPGSRSAAARTCASGLHFAYMQIKVLMSHLLTRYRIELHAGSGAEWAAWPIPRPKDGLPVTFVPLAST